MGNRSRMPIIATCSGLGKPQCTCLLPFVFSLAAIILHFFGPYSATSRRKCSSSCVAHEVTTLLAARHHVHDG